jgi:hypothetical protein
VAGTFTTTASTSSSTIREASFPKDTDRLSRLHRNYSEQRFAGCIIRSNEYWNNYLSIELKGSLWVLEVGGTLVAWLSLRSRGDRFQLREFGVDTDCSASGVTTNTALTMLLAHVMKEIQSPAGSRMVEEWLLAVPTFILDECRLQAGEECVPYVDWPKLTNDDDLGWMYRYKIQDENVSIDSINGSSQTPHLIWPADSF